LKNKTNSAKSYFCKLWLMAHIATWCINIEFNSCVIMCVNIDYSNIQSELRAKNRSCCNSLKMLFSACIPVSAVDLCCWGTVRFLSSSWHESFKPVPLTHTQTHTQRCLQAELVRWAAISVAWSVLRHTHLVFNSGAGGVRDRLITGAHTHTHTQTPLTELMRFSISYP